MAVISGLNSWDSQVIEVDSLVISGDLIAVGSETEIKCGQLNVGSPDLTILSSGISAGISVNRGSGQPTASLTYNATSGWTQVKPDSVSTFVTAQDFNNMMAQYLPPGIVRYWTTVISGVPQAGFPVVTLPADWVVCSGQLFSRASYPALFAVVGTKFNRNLPGEDSTNFRLPASNGRRIMFKGNLSGGIGTISGTDNHTHSLQHAHTLSAHNHGTHQHYHTQNHYHVYPGHCHEKGTATLADGGGHEHDMSMANCSERQAGRYGAAYNQSYLNYPAKWPVWSTFDWTHYDPTPGHTHTNDLFRGTWGTGPVNGDNDFYTDNSGNLSSYNMSPSVGGILNSKNTTSSG